MQKFITVFLLAFLLAPNGYQAEEGLSDNCKKLLEETKAQYVNLVTNDVLTSFDLIEEASANTTIYFNVSDLWKSEYLTNDDPYITSLKKLMKGKYQGEKRLYFFNHDSDRGYILYKDIDDNNVMLTISKEGNQWTVINQDTKEGKKISVETTECKDQHFMQKMFDNLYP